MDKQQGAELSQLGRFLFDKAANYWQGSIILELLAGCVGIIVSIAHLSLSWNTCVAIIATLIMCAAYYSKFRFEWLYEDAETMRRQAVLCESLAWPIGRAQFNEWKSKAGKKLLKKITEQKRAVDYYETKTPIGPKRLAEMTFESAYWTINLYKKIKLYFSAFLITILAIFILLISLSVIPFVSQDLRIYIVYTIYLLIPVLITIDFLGIVIRCSKSIIALKVIEDHLEAVINEGAPKLEEVMRLVSEYNCIVIAGIPVPKWLFNLHHDEIDRMWQLKEI